MLVSQSVASAAFASLPSQLRAASVSPEYLAIDANRAQGCQPLNWLYTEGEEQFLFPFHRRPIPETPYFDIESAYPYGGPLSNSENNDFLKRANSCFSQWCLQNSVCVEFVRFHPMLENWRFFGGIIRDDRPTVWIDLHQNPCLDEYKTRARTAIRKALNLGLTVEWVSSKEGRLRFEEMYAETMKSIKANQFYFFSDSYFDQLFDYEKSEMAFCHRGDRLIGASLFLLEGDLLEYHLSASTADGKRFGASNLLIHHAAIRAQERGISRFYLGGGTTQAPENSLLFFKAGFSDHRAPFRTGARIHMEAEYESLKVTHANSYTANPGLVLFYRG